MPFLVYFLALFLLAPVPARAACYISKPVTAPADSLPYNLSTPSLSLPLESLDLKEISGLGAPDEAGVLCAISDEKGEVLFLDTRNGGAIVRRVLFREKGDFEGVEQVKKCLYAVKSKGELYEIIHWKSKKPVIRSYNTLLTKANNIEGLCYDPQRNALLLACKGDPDSAYLRDIYAFDLRTKQLDIQPVYTLNPLEINTKIPYDEHDKPNFFSPSGIAIHPFSHQIYVLSSALKRLAVLDYATGNLLYAVRLNKHVMPQPEGISFDANGNLFICSEGRKGEGLLFRFDYLTP